VKKRSLVHIVLANGAKGPSKSEDPLILDYRPTVQDRVVKIGLPKFVQDVYHLPDRLLDLLELAGYIYAADRCVLRGQKDAVEYQSWSRSFEFHVRVRDHAFWSQNKVKDSLAVALTFMSGDADYQFHFEPGHRTPPTGLFDRPGFSIQYGEEMEVTLFSGGLDSLCGAIELLESGLGKVILVSHRSQSGTVHTQNALVSALQEKYPGRVLNYSFECTLHGIRAKEESQRTRSFLYTSIAYAIASAYGKNIFDVFENGVTSLNLHRREDLANSRASRTTHPQTIGRIAEFLSLIQDSTVSIQLPFLYRTKTDVISSLRSKAPELISSTVSCSRTFQTHGQATHCGQCFQCVDRRIAIHAAEAENLDHGGLYTHNIINETVKDVEARTTLVDYVRQSLAFSGESISSFENDYLSDLAEVLDYIPKGITDAEKTIALWELLNKHGRQVSKSISRIRDLYDDVARPIPKGSLLHVVSSREHLKPTQNRLVDSIISIINPALGDMFSRNKPKDEPDLNKKLGVLLRTHEKRLRSEHPTVSFACAMVVPDHTNYGYGVFIEAKYIRGSTSPSKATEGIAADLTKYPQEAFILFVVYDPDHKIPSDSVFKEDIQGKGRNRVIIIR
jgi:7-cyano-7-deazaguanine synthase in queuosine biosynthesis